MAYEIPQDPASHFQIIFYIPGSLEYKVELINISSGKQDVCFQMAPKIFPNSEQKCCVFKCQNNTTMRYDIEIQF